MLYQNNNKAFSNLINLFKKKMTTGEKCQNYSYIYFWRRNIQSALVWAI